MSDAAESTASLTSRIVSVYSDDLKKHLVQIAGRLFGSMKMLGRPAGLYKNIGGGVKDFFYEASNTLMQFDKLKFDFDFFYPFNNLIYIYACLCICVCSVSQPYEGMMHSPKKFAKGLGKGTKSLVTHVAKGVLTSTASVVESATQGLAKGAAFLSGAYGADLCF